MAKKEKTIKNRKKEKLKKIQKKLADIGKELSKIEEDLAKSRDEETSLVEEDMKRRQKVLHEKEEKTGTVENPPEGDGMKFFYRKFVSKLRKSLK